jgi:hypothetical protein
MSAGRYSITPGRLRRLNCDDCWEQPCEHTQLYAGVQEEHTGLFRKPTEPAEMRNEASAWRHDEPELTYFEEDGRPANDLVNRASGEWQVVRAQRDTPAYGMPRVSAPTAVTIRPGRRGA